MRWMHGLLGALAKGRFNGLLDLFHLRFVWEIAALLLGVYQLAVDNDLKGATHLRCWLPVRTTRNIRRVGCQTAKEVAPHHTKAVQTLNCALKPRPSLQATDTIGSTGLTSQVNFISESSNVSSKSRSNALTLER